jgi:Cof subfamily protein (haloacid dehalogenase superfamily)
MARFKMIAIDLDGTLLSPEGRVTDRTRLAVRRALSAGLLVCFATGRNLTESQAILEAVAHYDTAVFVGGAMVIDTRRRATLHRTAMDPALAAEVCGVIEQMGHAALALQDTGIAGVDYLITADAPQHLATEHWMIATNAKVHLVLKLGAYAHPHTIRVGIVADEQQVQQAVLALEARFGSRVVCQKLRVPGFDLEVLEVFDPAVNKWEGVLHVARHHGVQPDQIVAIGDDVNDIPMLRGAGLGVAMGNARPAVLAVASRVIKSNREDGLAEFLDELVDQHLVEPAPPERSGP